MRTLLVALGALLLGVFVTHRKTRELGVVELALFKGLLGV